MPKISIIIPIYNVQDYLRHCLDSVLAQTFCDWEAICVNDGSPDKCDNILSEYAQKDKRFKIISQKNQGVSVARNTALQHAQGEYISFLDADDELAPTFLEKMHRTITNTDADIVWCDFIQDTQIPVWQEKSTQIKIYNYPFDRFVSEKPNMEMVIWNKMYHISAVRQHQFICGLKHGEDIVFLHQTLYNTQKAVHIPQPLYFYRERQDSIVHTPFNQKIINDASIVVQTLMHYFEDKPMPASTRKTLLKKFNKRLFKFFVQEPKRKDKVNTHKWYDYSRPLLKQLKKQGVYQPRYLTIKNQFKSYVFLKGK